MPIWLEIVLKLLGALGVPISIAALIIGINRNRKVDKDTEKDKVIERIDELEKEQAKRKRTLDTLDEFMQELLLDKLKGKSK